MNTARTVKATILLDIIQTINNKSHDIMNENLIVAMDNKVVWQMIHREIVVPNYYNQNTAAEACAIEIIIQ